MNTSTDEEFILQGKDARAAGMMTDRGFVVRAGAIARKEIVPSATSSVAPVRNRLLSEGVLVDEADGLRFTKDHVFDSPSGAAAVVLGRTANGWIEWKRPDGQTLSKAKRVSPETDKALLDDAQRVRILERHQQLLNEGKLATQEQLDNELSLFRERFGPDVLAERDGEALLTLMHDNSNRDSLVYWLEFKNDDEFETRRFGGIAGGSALKFRLFRRKETGSWQASGDKANRPKDITKDEAVRIARLHRDQLLEGAKLLEALSESASSEDYAQLQDQMDERAPDVSRLAWGHKYFSLLFPQKLDDYHNTEWQRFILLKMLQLPPEGSGRYICASRFVAMSREVGIPIVSLDSVLKSIHGNPHRYWRVGTTPDNGKTSYWEMMRERGCVAAGAPKLGDISWVEAKQESRERLRKLLSEAYPNHPAAIGRDCSQFTHFVADISEGDLVLAADGTTVLGIGRVVGGYEYHPEFDFPHQRKVDWLNCEPWEMPISKEGLQSTVRELGKHSENILAIERRLQSPNSKPGRGNNVDYQKRLTGIPGRIQSILDRKGQVILFGPPGTGKTYWAELAANDLASIGRFGKPFNSLTSSEKEAVAGDSMVSGLVRVCCFHPAYGYEDFLEGYRPVVVGQQASFELRDGVFKKLCMDAASAPDRTFYLIVDEINRGDIPRIFGELLFTLDKEKRGKRIILPLSQVGFAVPRNVYIIGTMNTADRSISLLDAALRRRFGFLEMMPDGAVLGDSAFSGIALRAWFDALNKRIRELIGRDARNLQIGHSYFMNAGSPIRDIATLKRVLRDDVIPLLEEYCYEEFDTLEKILGNRLVDLATKRIRHELFDDGQEDSLVEALLGPFELSNSSDVISLEEGQGEKDAEEEDDA